MCSPSLPFLLIGEAISWPNSTNYYIPGLRFEIRARRTVASPLLTFNRLGKEDWETWHCLKKSVSPRPEQRIKKRGVGGNNRGAGVGGNLMDFCPADSNVVWAALCRLDGWWESHHEAGKKQLPVGAGWARRAPRSTGTNLFMFLSLVKSKFLGEEKKKKKKRQITRQWCHAGRCKFQVCMGMKVVCEGYKSIPVCHSLNALCRLSHSPVCVMQLEVTCCVISLNMPIIQPRDNLLNSSAWGPCLPVL